MERSSISADLAARLVAAQFPQWAHLPVRPAEHDGWDNTTFRLGDELSLRLPSADAYVAQVEKEHRWLPTLAPRLPLPIPDPVAKGVPGCGFPRPWSVYRWLPGRHAVPEEIKDLRRFARDLADFLAALYAVDPSGGPPAGAHSFHRGAPVDVYDSDFRTALGALADEIDAGAAAAVWDAALAAHSHGPAVWVHGDVTPSNLLVVGGRLGAVIDFGCAAVGDPACDLTIAWTFFFGESRRAFHDRLALDEETWARARGWALWKALITLRHSLRGGRPDAAPRFGWRLGSRAVIEEVLAECGRLRSS